MDFKASQTLKREAFELVYWVKKQLTINVFFSTMKTETILINAAEPSAPAYGGHEGIIYQLAIFK